MAILKGNILTFQIAEVAQALSENLPDWRVVDDANRCYLMRARSEWPRGHAAQRRYEFSATKVECHVTLPMGGYAHATKEMIPPFRRAVCVYFNAVASRRQAPNVVPNRLATSCGEHANRRCNRHEKAAPWRNRCDRTFALSGAGSGRLTVAAAAAGFGVPVVLIEKDKMEGDCLKHRLPINKYAGEEQPLHALIP
jgi:hypothetical protein